MSKDDFGDRMKAYEQVETARILDAHFPIYARIDGRSFSKFTRGCDRPYDKRIMDAMHQTTAYLVEKTNAKIGYHQSDEISLVWLYEDLGAQMLFAGKVHKLTSILAGMASAKFITCIPESLVDRMPHFDCRVCQLPSKTEAANMILWRVNDARRNSISMLAQSVFSHKALHQKSTSDKLDMLAEAGVVYGDYPDAFRNGAFFKRQTVTKELTQDELSKIPEDRRPTDPVIRSVVTQLDMDTTPYYQLADREAFIFG